MLSHVAKTYADAWWMVLRAAENQGEQQELRHEAWSHLGQVWDGYADLAEDLRSGRVQLPLGWRGIHDTSTPG